MAIQLRRGAYENYDASKLKPAEVGVVQSGDPNTTDGKAVYIAINTNDVKRIPTADEMVDHNAEAEGIYENIVAQNQTASQLFQNTSIKATEAEQSASSASSASASANSSMQRAETAANLLTNVTATAQTLETGQQATASYNNGVFSFGLPKGNTGNTGAKGDKGDTGATPNLSVGTVTTLEPGSDATVEITGTAEAPVLNMGIPRGNTGEVSAEQFYKAFATDTATGAVASFSDGADSIPMKDVLVHVDPVQDLHGYDGPWPAGGGKNIFDGEIEQGALAPSNGEKIANTERYRSKNFVKVKPNTRYRFSVNGTATSANIYSYDENKTYLSDADRPYANDFTTNASTHYIMFFGTSVLDSNKVQIEEGSAVTSFAPYSNICPITGWTAAKVTRTGKNLFNLEEFATMYPDNCSYSNDTLTVNSFGAIYNTGVSCYLPRGTIINCAITEGTAGNARIRLVDTSGYAYDIPTAQLPYILSRDFIGIRFNWTTPGTFSISNFQIEFGSTATDYEPYSGDTYDITFPTEAGTVYGGTLDVTTGELVVDRAVVTMDGSQTIAESQHKRFYRSIPSAFTVDVSNQTTYKGVISDKFGSFSWGDLTSASIGCGPLYGKGIAFKYPDMNTVQDWNTYFTNNPTQFSYELATPITYQLTPQEITSLLGENNVWADTGDTKVEYRADTKMYIARQIADAVSALS